MLSLIISFKISSFFRDEPEVNISELGVSEEYATEAKNELRSSANAILNQTEDDPKFNYSKVVKLLKSLLKLVRVLSQEREQPYSMSLITNLLFCLLLK